MPTAGALRWPIWIVCGLLQDLAGQLGDHRRHGRGEEQRLLAAGSRAMMRLRSGRKPMSSMRSASSRTRVCSWSKRAWLLPHVVEQPARRGDEDLDAGAQRFLLRPHRRAADEQADAQLGVVRQAQADVVDLLGQLARRRDDQRLRRAARQVHELMQDRQQEGGGLAGAGLGGGDQVAAGEDGGDGLGLDGRRLRVTHLARGLHQRWCRPRALNGMDVSSIHPGSTLLARPVAFRRRRRSSSPW